MNLIFFIVRGERYHQNIDKDSHRLLSIVFAVTRGTWRIFASKAHKIAWNQYDSNPLIKVKTFPNEIAALG